MTRKHTTDVPRQCHWQDTGVCLKESQEMKCMASSTPEQVLVLCLKYHQWVMNSWLVERKLIESTHLDIGEEIFLSYIITTCERTSSPNWPKYWVICASVVSQGRPITIRSEHFCAGLLLLVPWLSESSILRLLSKQIYTAVNKSSHFTMHLKIKSHRFGSNLYYVIRKWLKN